MSDRLSPIPDEWIDRRQSIEFMFEGQRYWGYAGDTVSSALWASGQRTLGRSFKYHRPRGILSLANHDINALMQAGSQLNVRADVTPIESGLSLTAVNTSGGVRGDRASVLNFLAPFMPVGFYYKAFHDKRWFPLWERWIRRMTGLGQLDVAAPRLRTPKRYDFCDVLVIGAGLSGLSAAITAADAGADVVIVDENARAGGSGGYQLGDDPTRAAMTRQLVEAATRHPRIRLYTETQAAGYYADHWVPLVDRQRLTKMRAKTVIVASGAYEQPAVFRHNDLPGIMLASAAQRLIYRYAVKPMQRAIVLTANRDGYRAALDLAAHGVMVQAIVDLRPEAIDSEPVQAVRQQGMPIWQGYCIYEAKSNPAKEGVTAAVVCPWVDGQPQPHLGQTLTCDGIVMSVGWAPAANLLYQAGAKMRFEEALQQFVPDRLPAGVWACGRVNGIFEPELKIQDGRRAGWAAVMQLGLADFNAEPFDAEPLKSIDQSNAESPSHPYPVIDHPAGKNFVDFDEDLQVKDFVNAAKEGFDNIELLKRYTTVGMGPSQGKHSNMNALRILARLKGQSPETIGTTTARPFFHPVPMSHLAGRGFTPERQTPLHSRHAAQGATWMPAGIWQRPEYYIQPGISREDCIRSEVETVRTGVGLIDVGTLGKLELCGAEAVTFLERVYTGKYAGLKPGMSRYALMLDEAGIVIDDGVIARLAPDRFYFTTTTSGSTPVYRELTRLNTLWQLDCGLINLTGAHAALNLAGPRSRDVLAPLTDLDLSATAFPYLAVREGRIADIPALLMRVGFVGEWGYEIHVAADYAAALWDTLMEAGAAYGIRPFGVEAQRVLRLEKGHLIVGQDTDGLTTPFEAGLEWAVKWDKPFFIGQRSLQIRVQRPPHQKLVGFQLEANFQGVAPQACHLVIEGDDIAGRVTSIAFSPSLQRYIGLAYVPIERAAVGQSFTIRRSDGSQVTATVSATPFYDPENLRQRETVALRQEISV